jgi:uncharacterized membrane protein YgcG
MSEATVIFAIIGGVLALLVGIVLWSVIKGVRSAIGTVRGVTEARGAQKRQEALFATTFPELQPHFHPEKVLQFLNAWRSRTARPETVEWNNPPGFGQARMRLMPKTDKGQPAELLDAAGEVVSAFILQDNPEGGVIRLGSGKLTANLRDSAVRYWHPQREFKWSRAKGWRVINSLSDRGIDSDDRGMSFSSDSSLSSSSTASRAATGAVPGAGGAFDGGGSSSSWDGGSDSTSGSESRTSY